MMFNYPFFGFKNRTYPYKYYNYSNYNYPSHYKIGNQPSNETTKNISELTYDNVKKENRKSTKNEEFFSILGIHLYFDDLIILSLLFFLYNEGIKDEGLFICLILLLLS